jgi:hypothetical protein
MDSVIIISYIPLLLDNRTIVDPEDSEIESILKDALEVNSGADFCLWVDKDGQASPVLVFSNAEDLADHINTWSENKPEEWFDIQLNQISDSYSIALMPRLEKSVERWRVNYQLTTGYPPKRDLNVNLVFNPLHFATKHSPVFENVKPHIKSKTKIGLLNLNGVKPEEIQEKLDTESIMWLGPFDTKWENNDYMKNLLNDLEDPKSKSIKFREI